MKLIYLDELDDLILNSKGHKVDIYLPLVCSLFFNYIKTRDFFCYANENYLNWYLDKNFFEVVKLTLSYSSLKQRKELEKTKGSVDLVIKSEDPSMDLFALLYGGQYFTRYNPNDTEKINKIKRDASRLFGITNVSKNKIKITIPYGKFHPEQYFTWITRTQLFPILHLSEPFIYTTKEEVLKCQTVCLTDTLGAITKMAKKAVTSINNKIIGKPSNRFCGFSYFYGALEIVTKKDVVYTRKILKKVNVILQKATKDYMAYIKKNGQNLDSSELDKVFNKKLWFHALNIIRQQTRSFKGNKKECVSLPNMVKCYS